ncbi:uncharacterized protein TNCT_458041 [Trichonephila clavata]|uniref:Uncharacterized protein n=1 Tax=Trichonephila clavata TaxID=2740835 RepID=A0A8X6JBX4_TRICU|nr:uncharacterized protein TNCT_458041 [Trichonephila clavata]
MQDRIKQSVYGSYFDFGDGKNWSIHRTLPTFHLIPKIKEPICDRRFATREDIANAVCQHVTRFTHGAANAEADGIQRLPHRWQRVVTVAGDYIEGL